MGAVLETSGSTTSLRGATLEHNHSVCLERSGRKDECHGQWSFFSTVYEFGLRWYV